MDEGEQYEFGRWTEKERDASRVEAFSDAVIAIVLTLMSVELLQLSPQRPEGQELPDALFHEWPAYLAYVITFAIVGQVWLTHHNMWRYVVRVDQLLVVLNLLLLLFVAAIPFAASLLADNLRGTPADQRLTAALYVGTVLGEALFFNLSWWWARRRRLLHPGLDPRLARAVARRFLLGPCLTAPVPSRARGAPTGRSCSRSERGAAQRPRSARMRRAALWPAAPITLPAGWQPALPA
ncbi:TMEM175 family protein [Micromonospora sp. NBC_00421]